MFSVKFAGQLADAALSGEGGLLEQIVAKKLEAMGEDLIMEFLGGPLGVAERVKQAVATGGQSEFDRKRDEFLHSLKPGIPHSSLIRKLESLFGSAARGAGKGGRRGHSRYGWQASDWATSRDDWLGNRWHHDWRSQPRDEHGRWMPGRLDYIAAQLQYRGKSHAGRKVLRRRKLRKMRRLATRREIRKLLKKGIRDGY